MNEQCSHKTPIILLLLTALHFETLVNTLDLAIKLVLLITHKSSAGVVYFDGY